MDTLQINKADVVFVSKKPENLKEKTYREDLLKRYTKILPFKHKYIDTEYQIDSFLIDNMINEPYRYPLFLKITEPKSKDTILFNFNEIDSVMNHLINSKL